MRKSWSKKEDEILRSCVSAGTQIKIIQRDYLPGRTEDAIVMRRHTLQIGRRKPGIRRIVFTISIPEALANIVRECAVVHGLSYSAFLAGVVAEYLDQ